MDGTSEKFGNFLPKLISVSGSGRVVLMSAKGTLDEPHERSQTAAQRLRTMGSGTTARTGMRL